MTTGTSVAAARTAQARLVEYARERHAALPAHCTIELLERPAPVAVPGAPAHVPARLAWRGQWLPLLRLNALVHPAQTPRPDAGGTAVLAAPRYALVVAYRPAADAPLVFGAIALARLPLTVTVHDGMAAALPADGGCWDAIALSAFTHDGRTVPILDPARLFGPAPAG